MPPISPENLTQSLKSEAHQLGFHFTGACPAVSPTGINQFEAWLDAGYAGEMSYLQERRDAYHDPQNVFDGAASILVLGLSYQTVQAVAPRIGEGRVSKYAWSDVDYHDVIHKRLKQLVKFCESLGDGHIQARGVVDTAPLLEREFAQLAGLGWQAKNTLLINKEFGSWFFLAALLTNATLVYDQPFESFHCGTCTACLDQCPTDAFVSPGVLDARRCISYLTIELRNPIPLELRASMGDWVFGCDVCQDVCPWNNKSAGSNEKAFLPFASNNPINLRELFYVDDEGFRQRFRKTPLWRTKRRGMVRNAAIALGNRPADANIAALEIGLQDSEPLIRGASAWALSKHSRALALPTLKTRHFFETDPDVKFELARSISELNGKSE